MTLTKRTIDGATRFWCLGCEKSHIVSDRWSITGTPDCPTFSPSVLVTSGHYVPGWVGPDCWCTFNAKHPDKTSFECFRCHSFVVNGRIQYLGDSTHALARMTVDMEPLRES